MNPVSITCKVVGLGDDVGPCWSPGVELVTVTEDESVFFAIPLTEAQAQQLGPAMFAEVDVTIARAGSAEAGEDELAARVAELERELGELGRYIGGDPETTLRDRMVLTLKGLDDRIRTLSALLEQNGVRVPYL